MDNQNFFRPKADFISLIITNEDERKEDPSRATTAEDVLNSFLKRFSDSKRFIAYNIIVKDINCLNSERAKGGIAHIAKSISRLAELTNGANINLCSQNYGSELRKISKDIKNKLENTVTLKKEPIPESVQIHFIKGPKLEWRLSGKQIIFENKAIDSSSIVVTYEEKRRFL